MDENREIESLTLIIGRFYALRFGVTAAYLYCVSGMDANF